MQRCVSSFVTAAYAKVGRIPQYSRALPLTVLKRHQAMLCPAQAGVVGFLNLLSCRWRRYSVSHGPSQRDSSV